jgi:hypothetical protein
MPPLSRLRLGGLDDIDPAEVEKTVMLYQRDVISCKAELQKQL